MTGTRPAFWKNKRVLVTGHEGFLGSSMTRILVERGARVTGFDKVKNRPISLLNGIRGRFKSVQGNVQDRAKLDSVLRRDRPEYIFHLAAEAIVGRAHRNPIEVFKTNIEGTWNILDVSRGKSFIRAVVVASSDKAYGIHSTLPYTEEAPLKGCYPYDVSKSCADVIAHAYFSSFGLPVAVTRCGNIFGPGDFNMSRLVPDTIRSALQGKAIRIRSDGRYTRDYIYVEDAVEGYLMLARCMKDKKFWGQAFNFSTEKPVSVLRLVKMVYRLCDREPTYRILNQVEGEIPAQYLSSAKAHRLIKWRAQYGLEEGLEKAIRWHAQHI